MTRRNMTPAERDICIEFYKAWVTLDNLAYWFDRDRNTIIELIARRGAHRGRWRDPNPNGYAIRQRRYRQRKKDQRQ